MPDGAGRGGPAAASLIFAGDSFILEDYLQSAQAIVDVAARLPLDEILGRDGGDRVRNYVPGAPPEDQLRHWNDAVWVHFDAVTGITTVRVSLFTPEDARDIAVSLVQTLGSVVDGLSANARSQALEFVDATYQQSEADLERARAAVAEFRREYRVVSPSEQANIGSEIISNLSNELAQRSVRLRSLELQSPSSPQIAALQEQIDAIEDQLLIEFDQRGGSAEEHSALPAQLSQYEELDNAYQIARDTYVNALDLKHRISADMVLREAQLVVFVPPRLPLAATEPKRLAETMTVFGAVFLAWLILRILFAGLRTQ